MWASGVGAGAIPLFPHPSFSVAAGTVCCGVLCCCVGGVVAVGHTSFSFYLSLGGVLAVVLAVVGRTFFSIGGGVLRGFVVCTFYVSLCIGLCIGLCSFLFLFLFPPLSRLSYLFSMTIKNGI